MEKCDLCGKETPVMQLGVRYCSNCGESVIRVCRACDSNPFYCKSCKRKKGKGWHESPDASGKAPDHRDAKLRAQAKIANNTLMVKMITNELYHVTFKSKSNKLKKDGIQPKRTHTYRGMFGRKLKDPGTIYAFSNFDDAVRWASKMQFDFKKPTTIVAFRGNISDWERDTHWQSAGAKGKWLKKKGTVLPNNIIKIIGLSQKMTRMVVQTGGTSKELTRMYGIKEIA